MHQDKPIRPETLPPIVIPARDHDRLMALAEAAEQRAPQVSSYLTQELCRADVVEDDEIDPNVARIGSHVTYRDQSTSRQRTVTLVWPHEADTDRNRVSVLTPIGAALLGMRSGQSIDWPSPVGEPRMLTVLSVHHGDAPPDAA